MAQEQRVLKVQQVQEDQLVLKVLRVQLVHKVLQERLVLRVLLVLMVEQILLMTVHRSWVATLILTASIYF